MPRDRPVEISKAYYPKKTAFLRSKKYQLSIRCSGDISLNFCLKLCLKYKYPKIFVSNATFGGGGLSYVRTMPSVCSGGGEGGGGETCTPPHQIFLKGNPDVPKHFNTEGRIIHDYRSIFGRVSQDEFEQPRHHPSLRVTSTTKLKSFESRVSIVLLNTE